MARPTRPPAVRLLLRLYVAGHAPNSVQAIASITAICAARGTRTHVLDIVDVLDHPQRALADGIIVTPTLVKLRPLPEQRLVGGLGDTAAVLRILEAK